METIRLTPTPSELILSRISSGELSKEDLYQGLLLVLGEDADHYFKLITKEPVSVIKVAA